MDDVEKSKQDILDTLLYYHKPLPLEKLCGEIKLHHQKAIKELLQEDKITHTGKGYEIL